MMRLSIWQLDAFASERFRGNPAAVVLLEAWPSDEVLRSIAAENNLAETAYLLRRGDGVYDIRWWTPEVEVPLCGHATLASAWVVFERLEPELEELRLASKSGELRVTRRDDRFTLDFPASPVEAVAIDPSLARALGGAPLEMHAGFQWLVVYGSAREVRELAPDFPAIAATGIHGVMVTARGEDADFVSRFFAPNAGVDEDAVTGSSHTRLAPFWAARLGKNELVGRQLSRRGGTVHCELRGDRVHLTGSVVLYLEGTIEV